MTARSCSSASSSARLLQRRGDRLEIHVDDLQVGFQHALAAVLESDLGLDVGRADSGVERLDQRPIALSDKAAATLPGAGKRGVVGVKFKLGRASGGERVWYEGL